MGSLEIIFAPGVRMKKGMKRLIMAIGIIVIIFVVFLCIKNAFNPPDSFYESSVTTEEGSPAVEVEASQQNATGEEAGVSEEGISTIGEPSKKQRELPQEVLNMSMADIKALQKKVPLKDKLAVLNILSTSLSAKEYTGLFGMLSGGITREEMKQAYNDVNRKLTPENREKIWGYYDKYKHLIP